jgi:hypothetical protein
MPRAPRLNAPEGTWGIQRAVGSPAVLERHLSRGGAANVISSLRDFKHLEIERCGVSF